MPGAPLVLHNSLTRADERFVPIDPGSIRVYSCGPTVYHYAHIGNLRAYVFTDTLSRVLTWKAADMGWGPLTHVINITDVGHLTSDADAGHDKMEARARETGQDIWAIAAHYTAAFKANLADLNIRAPANFPLATDHVPAMIDWGRAIEERHCYRLADGLYFDTSTVPDYGSLARQTTDEGEGRIAEVTGKRHPQDFAIWRTSTPHEHRQMEWDSPWGRGAPGWHLECSVMARRYLGERFDIHTGGIDHREIHHPNEIAQNQAMSGTADTGATYWLHNNFLVERAGKMSKSGGGFTTLQSLVDAGFHPLSYRLMCLQAHYRSELEFSWDNLAAAQTRLKRLLVSIDNLRKNANSPARGGDRRYVERLDVAMSSDLATPKALALLDEMLGDHVTTPIDRLAALVHFDEVLGLDLSTLSRVDLRVRPAAATIDEGEVGAKLVERKDARLARDFARSDAIRDDLAAAGVEVMDGDPLGWDWKMS